MVLKKEKALASLGHPLCVLETFSLLEMCFLTFWKKQRSPSIYGPYLDVQTHTWSSYLQQTTGLGSGGVVGTQVLDLALCPSRAKHLCVGPCWRSLGALCCLHS